MLLWAAAKRAGCPGGRFLQNYGRRSRCMAAEPVTRCQFVRDTAVAAAGVAVGLTPIFTVMPAIPSRPTLPRSSITTRTWNTAAAAGHLDDLGRLPGRTLEADRQGDRPRPVQGGMALGPCREFEKNRYDVVTRCIERGINYIDACCGRRCRPTQGPQGPPRQDAPGLSPIARRKSASPDGGPSKAQAGLRRTDEARRAGLCRPLSDYLPRAERPAHRRAKWKK